MELQPKYEMKTFMLKFKIVQRAYQKVINHMSLCRWNILLHLFVFFSEPKKYKYIVIGDGFIHGFLSKLNNCKKIKNYFLFLICIRFVTCFIYDSVSISADCSISPIYCKREQLIASALHLLSFEKLQSGKIRNVIISIGATDLVKGTSLPEMKRLFTILFRLCEKHHLRPIVTTIVCMTSKVVDEKARIFNQFILENFDNVIDLWDVFIHGIENTLVNMYKG